jgi:ABC-type nitrate/sulfonate/bicarbonate transport system ATPase subunit
MSSNPGRIIKRFIVDLPSPRDRASAEFIRLKRQVLVELHLYRQQPKDAQASDIDMALYI